jgi:hypothetical protein
MTVEEKLGKTTEELKQHIDNKYGEQLAFIRSNGFTPIGVSVMMFEDTFVFETIEEARQAGNACEVENHTDDRIEAWWYGREEVPGIIDDYEKSFKKRPMVFWIDNDNHITGISE